MYKSTNVEHTFNNNHIKFNKFNKKNKNKEEAFIAPGFAVLDLGCSKAMGSEHAKRGLIRILKEKGMKNPVVGLRPSETKYGFADGGGVPTKSDHLAGLKCLLGGQELSSEWEILKHGNTPLLMSLPQMENLEFDFRIRPLSKGGTTLSCAKLGWKNRPVEKQNGHLCINLAELEHYSVPGTQDSLRAEGTTVQSSTVPDSSARPSPLGGDVGSGVPDTDALQVEYMASPCQVLY